MMVICRWVWLLCGRVPPAEAGLSLNKPRLCLKLMQLARLLQCPPRPSPCSCRDTRSRKRSRSRWLLMFMS